MSCRIISQNHTHVSRFLPKMCPPLMLHCCPQQVWTTTFAEFLWKILGRKGESHHIAKNLPTTKIPIKKLISSPIKSDISFLSNENFHVINPIQASFGVKVVVVVSLFFNFRLYVYTFHANFD